MNVQAAKYLEGKVIAIKTVRTLLAAAHDAVFDEVVDEAQSRWRASLPEGYHDNLAWRSYAEGGLDALAELRRLSGK